MPETKEVVSIDRHPKSYPSPGTEQRQNGSGDPRVVPAARRRLPDERRSLTHHFSIGGQEGYVTVGLYEDGLPGELFIRMAKEGSNVSGLMDTFATAVSLALVPLKILSDKFSHTHLSSADGRAIRRLASPSRLWIISSAGSNCVSSRVDKESCSTSRIHPNRTMSEAASSQLGRVVELGDAPTCQFCGSLMVRNGSCSCYRCLQCGSTSGCS